jgi:hypothetical protein
MPTANGQSETHETPLSLLPFLCSPTAFLFVVLCVFARATRRANSEYSDCPRDFRDSQWVHDVCMRRESRLSFALHLPHRRSSREALLNWQRYPFGNCSVFLCRVARTFDPRGSGNVNDWHTCRLHPGVSAHLWIPLLCAHWVRDARLFVNPLGCWRKTPFLVARSVCELGPVTLWVFSGITVV